MSARADLVGDASSPPESYNNALFTPEDFAKEPPACPPHLHLTLLNVPQNPDAPNLLPRPMHTVSVCTSAHFRRLGTAAGGGSSEQQNRQADKSNNNNNTKYNKNNNAGNNHDNTHKY